MRSSVSKLPTDASGLESLKVYYQTLVADYEHLLQYVQSRLAQLEGSPKRVPAAPKVAPVPVPVEKSKRGRASKTVEPAIVKVEEVAPKKRQNREVVAAKEVPARGRKPGVKAKAVESEPMRGSRRNSALKLLKPYQGNTFLEALGQVLQERKGAAVSADTMVLALYGDLKPNLYKVAKDRVTKGLSKGKMEGKWDRVPDQLGCYTLTLSSLKN